MNIQQIPKGQKDDLATMIWRKVKKARRSPEFRNEFEIWERERKAEQPIREEQTA